MKTISLTVSLATLALVSSAADLPGNARMASTFGSTVAGVTEERLDRGLYFNRANLMAGDKNSGCMATAVKSVSVTASPRAVATFPHLGKAPIVTTECVSPVVAAK